MVELALEAIGRQVVGSVNVAHETELQPQEYDQQQSEAG
jgi:hypothetical protein